MGMTVAYTSAPNCARKTVTNLMASARRTGWAARPPALAACSSGRTVAL